MEIRFSTILFDLMFYWPFLLSGIALLFFRTKLPIGKLGLLFGIGILSGYGVSIFLMMPITMLMVPLVSVFMAHETFSTLILVVHISGSALLTGLVLWALGRSLSAQAKPSDQQSPPNSFACSASSTLQMDDSGMNKIVVNITKEDYLHSQWLHHKISAWRIIGVIILATLMGVFAREAANFSTSISIGGVIAYLAWYFLDYFIILRYRSHKIYDQQKMLHIPTEVIWSNEKIEFMNANGTGALKWSDYVKHKENDKLFLLYQSDFLFNMIPKSSFLSREQLNDFSSNLKAIYN